MGESLSFFTKKYLLIGILLTILAFFIGFIYGKYVQLKIQNVEIANIKIQNKIEKTKNDEQIAFLTKQVYGLKNGLGVYLGTKAEIYDKNEFGVYSPLLVGKKVEITTYQYKDATIIEKRVEIDNTTTVEIWQYGSEILSPKSESPEDFVTFGGYENYALHATTLNELKKSWQDSYINKNGIEMQYSYEYTPKNIGVIGLNSYHNYFSYRNPKPVVMSIWYNKIGGFVKSKDDSIILTAKKEINKIADSFEIVTP